MPDSIDTTRRPGYASVMVRPLRLSVAMLMLAAALLVAFAAPAGAASDTPGKVIAGYVEKVTLQPFDYVVKAKLDTGAMTSSVHATDIERFEKDGIRWVRFLLDVEVVGEGRKRIEVERPLARRVLVKGAEGEKGSRSVVELDMCFNGRLHTVEFTLADRDDLLYPVLLGRRFMNELVVIDPSETFLTKAVCDEPIEIEEYDEPDHGFDADAP